MMFIVPWCLIHQSSSHCHFGSLQVSHCLLAERNVLVAKGKVSIHFQSRFSRRQCLLIVLEMVSTTTQSHIHHSLLGRGCCSMVRHVLHHCKVNQLGSFPILHHFFGFSQLGIDIETKLYHWQCIVFVFVFAEYICHFLVFGFASLCHGVLELFQHGNELFTIRGRQLGQILQPKKIFLCFFWFLKRQQDFGSGKVSLAIVLDIYWRHYLLDRSTPRTNLFQLVELHQSLFS
mmetsp:Transcript_18649/g.46160  ORF Transcript_18649/g.46160 Transcript_18649/m.46160 type:complete len:232 (-) Transcript_18649:171-866(-)